MGCGRTYRPPAYGPESYFENLGEAKFGYLRANLDGTTLAHDKLKEA